MSILRMGSFKASYALFLKLVSGTIRTIAISASAMVGAALVCLRIGTTDLRTLISFVGDVLYQKNIRRFLAYHMPECQVTHIFSISTPYRTLTTSLLAYQIQTLPHPTAVGTGRRKRGYASCDHGKTD